MTEATQRVLMALTKPQPFVPSSRHPATRRVRINGVSVEQPIYYACTFCEGAVSNDFANKFLDVKEITPEQFTAAPLCPAAHAEMRA